MGRKTNLKILPLDPRRVTRDGRAQTTNHRIMSAAAPRRRRSYGPYIPNGTDPKGECSRMVRSRTARRLRTSSRDEELYVGPGANHSWGSSAADIGTDPGSGRAMEIMAATAAATMAGGGGEVSRNVGARIVVGLGRIRFPGKDGAIRGGVEGGQVPRIGKVEISGRQNVRGRVH